MSAGEQEEHETPSDYWRAIKDESRSRRARNRQGSAELLTEAGVKFESKNLGAHLIVRQDEIVVDFWPGTGRWVIRGGGRGFGVGRLLSALGRVKESAS